MGERARDIAFLAASLLALYFFSYFLAKSPESIGPYCFNKISIRFISACLLICHTTLFIINNIFVTYINTKTTKYKGILGVCCHSVFVLVKVLSLVKKLLRFANFSQGKIFVGKLNKIKKKHLFLCQDKLTDKIQRKRCFYD